MNGWIAKMAVLEECLKSWPTRPNLDSAEWPFTPDELDQRVTSAMSELGWLMPGPTWRYANPREELLQRVNDMVNGRDPGTPLNWKGL
jgi:hypothetical protein